MTSPTEWSKTKLSLERPYKDASGIPIRQLWDITADEEFVYEKPKEIDEQLGTRIQRVFDERGNTVWDEFGPGTLDQSENEDMETTAGGSDDEEPDEDDEEELEQDTTTKKKPMTVDELAKLRTEVVPDLM